MIKRICIVRLSALGDAIMLVPLVRTLQRHFPLAKITWVISNPAYMMLKGLSGVDFILVDKPKSLTDYWQFYQQMKGQQFDVLLATQASFRANLLYPLISAKRKIGYDKARANDGQRLFVNQTIAARNEHTLEGFVQFAKALGAKKSVIEWDLPIGQDEFDWVNQHLPQGRVLAINPAASKPERAWPVDKTIALIQSACLRWDVKVVLTGGPTELDRSLAEKIITGINVPVIDLVGKTAPKQLIALLKQVDCLVCPDTGPAHMATAVGTPVIGLYAVNPPHISGPYLSQNTVVNRYPDAVKLILGKEPNQVSWTTRVHSAKAMELITVDDVMNKLRLVFDK